MSEYKIFELTAATAMGVEKFKVRAASKAQAEGMADAAVADAGRSPVRTWIVTEPRTACFTHEGCDGADDTHEAIREL